MRILLAAVLLSAGCASAQKRPGAEAASGAAAARAEGPVGDAAALSPLSDSAIPKGECGMVLWTLDGDRPAPIFRYVVGKDADLVIDGKPTRLVRSDFTGSGGFGVAERQTFANDAGLSVTVEARFSLGFDGGNYLERGIISVETAGGWKTVVPAAGIAGCRS